MILAAGFGTRLRPITNALPKPLVPISGIPLIYVTIKRLALMQVDEIFVNGHYLWEKLKAALETIPFPHPPITFSRETPEILGTAGGIGAIREFLNGEDLLVLSSDIITDFDIEGLIDCHKRSKAFATMGLLKPRRQGKTPVWCLEDKIIGFGEDIGSLACGEPGSFSVIQMLSNEFIKEIPEREYSEIIPFYKRFLSEGKTIKAFFTDPLWYDIGEPAQLQKANQHIRQLLESGKLPPQIPIVEILSDLPKWKAEEVTKQPAYTTDHDDQEISST